MIIFVVQLFFSMYYPTTVPLVIQKLFPQLIWRIPLRPQEAPTLYLTFDDGPTPKVTEWVLKILADYGACATFFCIGKNVVAYPDIYQQILEQGHQVGNHTFDHLNGWQTPNARYFNNIEQCAAVVSSSLFRPPYGRLFPSQIRFLQSQTQLPSKIILWDTLSGDFDVSASPEWVLHNVLKGVQPGSIVLFHDSVKAFERLRYALPRVLAYFGRRGWRMEGISELVN